MRSAQTIGADHEAGGKGESGRRSNHVRDDDRLEQGSAVDRSMHEHGDRGARDGRNDEEPCNVRNRAGLELPTL